jgi:hypothetical protein
VKGILLELWGLFVDDGKMALGLIFWVAILGLASRWTPIPVTWNAPLLFLGCLGILMASVVQVAKRRSSQCPQ